MGMDYQILQEKRYKTDQEADMLVKKLFLAGKAHLLYEIVSTSIDKLLELRSGDDEIQQFIHHKPVLPRWLKPDRLKKASDFYGSYALEIMMLLGAVSLPSCYAASPGNKVLYISEKIRQKPGKRLLETAAFVIAISEPGAFEQNGIGYPAVQQVRLIHAIARYHILKSEEWDLSWGLPANEEDMAGTNLAFSYTVLAALKESGYKLRDEDLNAYLHLWKWVGYLMKIEDTLLVDRMEEAFHLDQALRERNFRRSLEGISLMRSLIGHYREALPKGLGNLVESQIKYFVGPEVAEILDLKSTSYRDLVVKIMGSIKKYKNYYVPHRPTYDKMKKDHERLRELYLN
jgi:hypothetical protein